MNFRRGRRHVVRTEKEQHVLTATIYTEKGRRCRVSAVTVRQQCQASAQEMFSPRTPVGIAFSV
jgi:hypothetical protein